MTQQQRHASDMTDDALDEVLRDVGRAIAYPAARPAGRDIAAAVRARLERQPARSSRGLSGILPRARPLRRSLVLALAALLILAAVAGAIGFGLPGIRIIFGDPPSMSPPAASSSASQPGALGSALGLGAEVSLDEVEGLVGFELLLPSDPTIGRPDSAFVDGERVALVWGRRSGLPAGPDGIALLISELRGSVDDGYYRKVVDTGGTVEPVSVDGGRGYWISGPPHFFMYIDRDGSFVEDNHRLVGDTLIWTNGDITFRLESSLGRDAAIELAGSLE